MERSRVIAAVVGAVVVFGGAAGGMGWHANEVRAEAEAAQAAQAKAASDQAEARQAAADQAAADRKLAAIDAAQRRVETGQAARYTAQEREGLRPKAEKAHFNQGVTPTVAYADNGYSPANNDPDAQIMPDDDAETYRELKQSDDEHNARTKADQDESEWQQQHSSPNPYFNAATQ